MLVSRRIIGEDFHATGVRDLNRGRAERGARQTGGGGVGVSPWITQGVGFIPPTLCHSISVCFSLCLLDGLHLSLFLSSPLCVCVSISLFFSLYLSVSVCLWFFNNVLCLPIYSLYFPQFGSKKTDLFVSLINTILPILFTP